MILRPVRWAVSIFVTFAVAWLLFMVPFGRFTLFEHARRIMATDEAQELGAEASAARARLTDEVVRQVGAAARADAGAGSSPSAGAASPMDESRAPGRFRAR